MEINIDKMLQEQKQRFDKIQSQPLVREDTESVYLGELPTVTRTTIAYYNGEIVLSRYIAGKYYKAIFDDRLLAKDIAKWFSVEDRIFIKATR